MINNIRCMFHRSLCFLGEEVMGGNLRPLINGGYLKKLKSGN